MGLNVVSYGSHTETMEMDYGGDNSGRAAPPRPADEDKSELSVGMAAADFLLDLGGRIIEPFDTSPSPCTLVKPRSGVEGRKYPCGGVIAMVMYE